MRTQTTHEAAARSSSSEQISPDIPPLAPWLFGTLLPFWADTGVDRVCGGFVERLTRRGAPADDDYKRIRVQARQIYVFSHAHLLGAGDYALTAAREGYRFLTGHGWDDDGGGWRFSVTRDGMPLELRKELYCQAFVLLALAWYHRATGSAEPLAWAQRTLDFLDETLADTLNGGWFEAAERGDPRQLPIRRQNPHMHLFEAMLALHEATGENGWLERALYLKNLLTDRFTNPSDGGLGEYFMADWRPARDVEGRVREPGHHFEWVWLLHRYHLLSGDAGAMAPAGDLYRFAHRFGIDRSPGRVPATFDEIDEAGTPVKDSKRLWPQTETLKADLALFEYTAAPRYAGRARNHLAMMFRHYLDAGSPLWRERLTRDGRDEFEFVPASSLYHLFIAMAEARRVLQA